jgi:hypothetical protein
MPVLDNVGSPGVVRTSGGVVAPSDNAKLTVGAAVSVPDPNYIAPASPSDNLGGVQGTSFPRDNERDRNVRSKR